MGNGGVRRSDGAGPANIPDDPEPATGTEGVGGAEPKDVSVRSDAEKSGSENSASNAAASRQQATEKGLFQNLAGKLLFADLQAQLKQAQAPSFNDQITKQLKELNLDGKLLGDPKSAAALVRNPEVFERILKEGTKETKQLLGNALLADPNLTNTEKLEILKQLTEPRANANNVTMDDIARNASPEGLKGLGKLAAGIMDIPPGSARLELYDLLHGVGGSSISNAMSQIQYDKSLTDEQKTKMTGSLAMATNVKELDLVFGNQHNNPYLQKALTGDTPAGVFVKLSGNIKPDHEGDLVDLLNSASPPKVDLLARSFPLKTPAHTNAAIDRTQEVGQLQKLLRTTNPETYFSDLTPENAGAISAEYSRMAEAEKDPNLAKEWRQRAMNLDGFAENRLGKKEYDEYVRVRDHYHR